MFFVYYSKDEILVFREGDTSKEVLFLRARLNSRTDRRKEKRLSRAIETKN